jgi:hypothetical protein
MFLPGVATRIWSQFCHLDVIHHSFDELELDAGLDLASPDATLDE